MVATTTPVRGSTAVTERVRGFLAVGLLLCCAAAACAGGVAPQEKPSEGIRGTGLLTDGGAVDSSRAAATDARTDAPRADSGGVPPQGVTGSDGGVTGSTLAVDELQVSGTHNSYHQAPLIAFHASHKYSHLPLDQQLSGGVRALELDLHLTSEGSYEIYHINTIDPNASCKTLDDCLRVIATWSTGHPRHTPVFLWLEIKDDTGGLPIDDLVPIEAVIVRAFARERLITPAWLRGPHTSPRARLMAAGWPTIDEARGKVMIALIDRDERTKRYVQDAASLDDRLMWVNAAPTEFTQPWAVITKVEALGLTDVITAAHAARLLIASNTCTIDMDDAACTVRFKEFAGAGVHMMHDDLPFRLPGRGYWLDLPNGSPGCNPVTAAARRCSAAELE